MTVLKLLQKEKKAQKTSTKCNTSTTSINFNTLRQYEKTGILEKFLAEFENFTSINDKKSLNLIFDTHVFADVELRTVLFASKVKQLLASESVEGLEALLLSYSFDAYEVSKHLENLDYSDTKLQKCFKILFEHVHVSASILDSLFNNKCYDLIEFLVDLGKCKRYELSIRLDNALKALSDSNVDVCLFLIRNGASLYAKKSLDSQLSQLSDDNAFKLRKLCFAKNFLTKQMSPAPFQDFEFEVIGRPKNYDHVLSTKLCVKLLRSAFVCDYIYEMRTEDDLSIDELLALV